MSILVFVGASCAYVRYTLPKASVIRNVLHGREAFAKDFAVESLATLVYAT